MSLITIIYKALLLSTAMLFVMLIGSYLAFTLKKKRNKIKNQKTHTKTSVNYSREISEVEKIKKIHNQTLAIARNSPLYAAQHNNYEMRKRKELSKSRYNIVNDSMRNPAKKLAEEAKSEREEASKNLASVPLDYYRNA